MKSSERKTQAKKADAEASAEAMKNAESLLQETQRCAGFIEQSLSAGLIPHVDDACLVSVRRLMFVNGRVGAGIWRNRGRDFALMGDFRVMDLGMMWTGLGNQDLQCSWRQM